MSETAAHDHELEVLEDDQNVPPRPEEQIADARDDGDTSEGTHESHGTPPADVGPPGG